jgi:hypothetical protein
VRGNWEAANRLLGTEFSQEDEDVKRFLEEEGAFVPQVAPGAPASFSGKTPDFDSGDTGSIPEAGILKEKRTDDEWCRLAKSLEPTVLGIASGTLRASAAQASTVRHILERCYGKVQEKQSEKRPASGVIVLPMLNHGQHSLICPNCGTKYGENDE